MISLLASLCAGTFATAAATESATLGVLLSPPVEATELALLMARSVATAASITLGFYEALPSHFPWPHPPCSLVKPPTPRGRRRVAGRGLSGRGLPAAWIAARTRLQSSGLGGGLVLVAEAAVVSSLPMPGGADAPLASRPRPCSCHTPRPFAHTSDSGPFSVQKLQRRRAQR